MTTNPDSATVDHHVKTWYAQPQYWGPQGKTAEWPDRILLDQGELLRDKLVLNLGCFYPEDEMQLAHLTSAWTAIDFVPEVIERCRALVNELRAHDIVPWADRTTFMHADMRKVPYPNCSFEVVTDFSSGDHLTLDDWLLVINEVRRVLIPGGLFLVCFANRDAFIKYNAHGSHWAERPDGLGEYGYIRTNTPAEMRAMVTARGFELVTESHCHEAHLRAGMLFRKVA